MIQTTLTECYEQCRGRGEIVMEGITKILDSANIRHSSNYKNTEIIASKDVNSIKDMVREERSSIANVDFMTSIYGSKDKTYIRLLYQ